MPNKLLTKLHLGQNFFRRQNPIYYLGELKKNAIRRKKMRYDSSRNEEIRNLHKKRRAINKGRPPKRWTEEEINYLIVNHKQEYKDIANKLGRSTGSIEHKVIRMGLIKNHKYFNPRENL